MAKPCLPLYNFDRPMCLKECPDCEENNKLKYNKGYKSDGSHLVEFSKGWKKALAYTPEEIKETM